MNRLYFGFFTIIFGIGIVLGDLPWAAAQESATEEFTLEEITVTAEKREENVQDLALSVTSISGADIRDQGKNTLNDVLRDIAAVQIGQGNRGGWVYIRGIGSYVDTSRADSAVAVMEDNVYNGNSMSVFGAMYDIDRVEVLRGPQGTLYGRNATGGTVNVVTKNPIHEFEALGNLQIGDYNLKHFDGAINIPLTEKWASRVAIMREKHDGYLSSGDMDANCLSVRAKLLYEPNDKISVLANYDYYWERTMGSNTVPIEGSAGNLPEAAWTVPDVNGDGVADDFLDADLNTTEDLDGDGYPDGDGIADLIQTGWILPGNADEWTTDEWHPGGSLTETKTSYSIEVNVDLDWSTLTFIPSYNDTYTHNVDSHLHGIATKTNVHSVDALGDGQTRGRKQLTGELRLTSPADSDWFWLGGLYYMRTENSAPDMESDPLESSEENGGWAFVNYWSTPYHTKAIFGQTTYPVTDRFRLTGGIRYSTDDNSRDYRYANVDVDPSSSYYAETDGTGIYDSGILHYEQEVSSTTYKAGIEFDATDDSMLYAQVSTGFKQGGLNTTLPPSTFEPEELVAYEFGSKNRFLDGRMQLNLEAYYYVYDNMQAQASLSFEIADTGDTGGAMAILNAGRTTPKGVDIEMDYLIARNDRITASLAYMDAKYGDFTLPPNDDAMYYEYFELEGRPIANSPTWSGTLAYEHTWVLPNGAQVVGKVDTKISTGYATTVEQYIAGWWQESYHRTNLNVTYNETGGKWSVGMWMNNLENDAQTTYATPLYRRMVNAPRTFGVKMSVRY